jgi:hypothetical protein
MCAASSSATTGLTAADQQEFFACVALDKSISQARRGSLAW